MCQRLNINVRLSDDKALQCSLFDDKLVYRTQKAQKEQLRNTLLQDSFRIYKFSTLLSIYCTVTRLVIIFQISESFDKY